MTINSLSPSNAKLINTEWINKILGFDHVTKKVDPNKGLGTKDVLKVLKAAKLTAVWHNFFNDPNSDYAEYIYQYMEGGSPALLVFTTNYPEMHVVPVIGHTLNSDIWHAEAELAYTRSPLNYRSASAWVDHFVINDDNFGMYLCLPVDSLRNPLPVKDDKQFRAYFVVSIVSIDAITPAREAEWAATEILKGITYLLRQSGAMLNIWIERLSDLSTPFVARTLLLNKAEYRNHLRSEKDFSGKTYSQNEITKITKDLPDNFFLTEITLPDLYTANKTKIVDILYSCDKKASSETSEIKKRWLLARMPEVCYFNPIVYSDKVALSLPVKSHFPLFRKNKDKKIPEW
ncbi:MAG: hypothetical protein ACYSR0_09970 [Planctomycetota bacterium]